MQFKVRGDRLRVFFSPCRPGAFSRFSDVSSHGTVPFAYFCDRQSDCNRACPRTRGGMHYARHGSQIDVYSVVALQACRSFNASLGCKYRDHERVSTSTQLLESGDQASCLFPEGVCIAINTGIDYRAVRSLDEIHKRVPEFNKLIAPRKKEKNIASHHHRPQPTATRGEGA